MLISEHEFSKLQVKKIGPRSVLTESFVKKPLKIFEIPREGICQIVFSNYGGGYVEGDQIKLSVECLPGTSTLFTSQANTRVYKSPNGSTTVQEIEVRQDKASFVAYLGDALVPQNDSIFQQRFHWNLEEEAVLLFIDWFEAGRILSGERFAFTSFSTELKVTSKEKTLVWDRFHIDPNKTNVNSPGSFLDHSSYMNVFLVGNEDLEKVKLLENHLRFIAKKYFQEERPLRMSEFPLLGSVAKVNETVFVIRCSARENDLLVPFIKELTSILEEKELLGFQPMERKY